MITLINIGDAPVGTITQYSATIGSITKIAGAQNITPGRYLHATTNSLEGDVPKTGIQVFVLFTALPHFMPSYGPTKYSPVAGAVNGVIGDWMLGSLRLKASASFMSGSIVTTNTFPPFILITSVN